MSSAKVTVTPVTSSGDQYQFIQFAWDHYRQDPHWIPPLRTNLRELLNYKSHPFYRTAEIQTFLARRDGRVVGRIAAIVDRAHNAQHQENRGMFGFFECINDQVVAKSLFDAVKAWFAERGITQLRGPVNPSMNYECALLVDGFHEPPTFGMTYNHSYYGELIEANGFQKAQDLYAFWGHVDMLTSLDPKLKFIAEQAQQRFNLNVRKVDKKHFQRDIEAFLHIYNHALPGTWGFVPMSDAELQHTAGGLKFLIVPSMTRIAEHEGRPVGCVFGLLDYNPLIKKSDGRLFPFGFLRMLFGRKHIKKVRLISTNVMPEFQRWGLGVVLLNNLVDDIVNWGVQEAEFSWVLESNHLSRASLERGGAKRVKTYRIYDFGGV